MNLTLESRIGLTEYIEGSYNIYSKDSNDIVGNFEENSMEEIFVTSIKNNNVYILDSGATSHLFNSHHLFSSYQPVIIPINTANADHPIITYGKTSQGALVDVLLSNMVSYCLVSTKKLNALGFIIVLEDGFARIFDKNGVLLGISLRHIALYILDEDMIKTLLQYDSVESCFVTDNKLFELHRRMAHTDMRNLRQAVATIIIVISDSNLRKDILSAELIDCPICYVAKPRQRDSNSTPTKKHS